MKATSTLNLIHVVATAAAASMVAGLATFAAMQTQVTETKATQIQMEKRMDRIEGKLDWLIERSK